MLKFWSVIIVASSFFFIGCGEGGTDNESNDSVVIQEEGGVANESESTEITGTEQTSTSDETVSPASGLNPPHGEPGHDCAIAVGAPLDGSGASQQPQTITPNLTTQPQMKSSPQGKAPANGLNPAHGEPGHDCAVAVGAPLPAK